MLAKQISDMTIEEAYDHLAKSIVIQAIEDYRKTLQKPNRYKRTVNNLKALERFFLSEWCYSLSGWDGDYIMKLIREQEGKTND